MEAENGTANMEDLKARALHSIKKTGW